VPPNLFRSIQYLIETIYSIRLIGGGGLGAFTGLTGAGVGGGTVGRAGAASTTKFLTGVSAEGPSSRGSCTFGEDFGVILSLIVVGGRISDRCFRMFFLAL